MFEFDDIIEEAVADVIEQAQNETQVEQMSFDPNSTDGYQYMIMLIENLNLGTHAYDKKEQHHFYNMLMHVMRSLCSKYTGDIIFYNYTTKQYNSEITGRIYESIPKSVGIGRYHSSQSCVSLTVKFSFDDDLSINARLSKLLRMFTAIESFKFHMTESYYKEKYNVYNCFLFKNAIICDEWAPMQKDKINIKDIYKNFHDASNYDKAFNDKIVWYYKDFFLNKDDSNELLVPVIEELKHLMALRWAIKVDSNYLRQFGHLPRQSFAEKFMRQKRT